MEGEGVEEGAGERREEQEGEEEKEAGSWTETVLILRPCWEWREREALVKRACRREGLAEEGVSRMTRSQRVMRGRETEQWIMKITA